jgi:hypothetical protein
MKKLAVCLFSLCLFAACSNEEVLPYEVPLVSCVEKNLPSTVVLDNLFNELGTIRVSGTSDNPMFSIIISGGLFGKDKDYGVCNLPTTLQKNGQRIRFDAVRMTDNSPVKLTIPVLSLTSIKLVK